MLFLALLFTGTRSLDSGVGPTAKMQAAYQLRRVSDSLVPVWIAAVILLALLSGVLMQLLEPSHHCDGEG